MIGYASITSEYVITKFDQDKPFGSADRRGAFNQVRVLERNGYGKHGEYICFDLHPFRTTKSEHTLAHLDNSRRTFLRLVEKVRSFDEAREMCLGSAARVTAPGDTVLDAIQAREQGGLKRFKHVRLSEMQAYRF